MLGVRGGDAALVAALMDGAWRWMEMVMACGADGWEAHHHAGLAVAAAGAGGEVREREV